MEEMPKFVFCIQISVEFCQSDLHGFVRLFYLFLLCAKGGKLNKVYLRNNGNTFLKLEKNP